MGNPSDKLDQITQNTQWTQQILLSLDIKTEEQMAARETALKNIAKWLKEDVHELRETFEE